jgi:hypothetical protein
VGVGYGLVVGPVQPLAVDGAVEHLRREDAQRELLVGRESTARGSSSESAFGARAVRRPWRATPWPRDSNYRLGVPSYEADVKPLFRERDRGAMLSHFDLWSYDADGARA